MLDWITKFGSLFLGGGGWGSFAAIIAAGVMAFVLYRMYKKSVQKKAENDTKEQSAEDNANEVENNQNQGDSLQDLENQYEDTYSPPRN